MTRSQNLLHLHEVQHLNGGTVYKPIEKSGDFQKLPKDSSNHLISEIDYLDLINDNPQFYSKTIPLGHEDDIDYIAFLGLKANKDELPPSPSPIPYGDLIISSFTIDKIEYFQTETGLFMKKKQSPIIEVCTPERYFLAKSFLTPDDLNHVLLHEQNFYKKFQKQNFDIPQAGLTRGSKRSFSDRAETQKNLIQKIQDKYKDGVK